LALTPMVTLSVKETAFPTFLGTGIATFRA
jgi:hypothetical protein